MLTTVLIISILFTLGVLYLSLITINKGYGYKQTIDPIKQEDIESSVEKKAD